LRIKSPLPVFKRVEKMRGLERRFEEVVLGNMK
jgi:hypothetical protein